MKSESGRTQMVADAGFGGRATLSMFRFGPQCIFLPSLSRPASRVRNPQSDVFTLLLNNETMTAIDITLTEYHVLPFSCE